MPASTPPPYVLVRCPRTKAEDLRIAALMDRTVSGDQRAWQDLCLVVAAISWGVTASSCATGRLRASMDDRLEIGVRVMGVLSGNGFEALRQLRKPGGHDDVRAWIATVAKHATVDHVRAHADRLGSPASNDRVGFTELSAALAARGPDPQVPIDARKIAQMLGPHLSPEQGEALALWVDSAGFAEIAKEMHLEDAEAADRLVRSALKRGCRLLAAPGEAPRRVGRPSRRRKKGSEATPK